jgi:hypothetical protein
VDGGLLASHRSEARVCEAEFRARLMDLRQGRVAERNELDVVELDDGSILQDPYTSAAERLKESDRHLAAK